MPNRFVRVTFEYVPRPPEEPNGEVGVFDLLLNEGGNVVGRSSFFGRWSEVTRETGKIERYPATLDERGIIDFGPGLSADQRHYSTNLRERRIVQGELCTVWNSIDRGNSGGTEWTYRVKAIEVLS